MHKPLGISFLGYYSEFLTVNFRGIMLAEVLFAFIGSINTFLPSHSNMCILRVTRLVKKKVELRLAETWV